MTLKCCNMCSCPAHFASLDYQHASQWSPDPRGRQCQCHPSGSLSAPVFTVVWPYFTLLVSVLVASLAKVPITSVAWHTQSSPWPLRYFEYLAHSSHACPLVFSTCPAPAGSRLPKRRAASPLGIRAAARKRAAMHFIIKSKLKLKATVRLE